MSSPNWNAGFEEHSQTEQKGNQNPNRDNMLAGQPFSGQFDQQTHDAEEKGAPNQCPDTFAEFEFRRGERHE